MRKITPICSSFPSTPQPRRPPTTLRGLVRREWGKKQTGKGNVLSQTEPGRDTHLEHQGGQLEDGLAVHLDLPLCRREQSVSGRARHGRGEGRRGGGTGEAVPALAARPALPAPCPPAATAHTARPPHPEPCPPPAFSTNLAVTALHGMPLRVTAPELTRTRSRALPALAMQQRRDFNGWKHTPSSGRGSQDQRLVWVGVIEWLGLGP